MDANGHTDQLIPAHVPRGLGQRLEDFFRAFDPVKCTQVVDILAKYTDEDELKSFLEDSYGVPGFFRNQHLHFGSAYFDAARALYEPHFVPPVPDARPLDNVHKAQILLPASSTDGPSHQVQLGVLHETQKAASDAAWWRGDVPATLFQWCVDALTGPMAWLKPLVKEHAHVRVMTRQLSPSGEPILFRWHGWLKGADPEGNLCLVDAVRERLQPAAGEAEDDRAAQAGARASSRADAGQADDADDSSFIIDRGSAAKRPRRVEREPGLSWPDRERCPQVILLGHTVLSIAADKSRTGKPPKDVDDHLRR